MNRPCDASVKWLSAIFCFGKTTIRQNCISTKLRFDEMTFRENGGAVSRLSYTITHSPSARGNCAKTRVGTYGPKFLLIPQLIRECNILNCRHQGGHRKNGLPPLVATLVAGCYKCARSLFDFGDRRSHAPTVQLPVSEVNLQYFFPLYNMTANN